jgi:hypothetical protein
MTAPAPDDLERRLGILRERQSELAAAGPAADAAMRALTPDIIKVAVRLGFDPEEAIEIAGRIDPPASGPHHAMAGEYRVLRGPAEPILTFSALVIAGAAIGLGQAVIGTAIIVVAVMLWVVGGALRVARLRIDATGALDFPGRLEGFASSELLRIDFAYRYPPFIAEHQKAASETVGFLLRLTGDRSVKLARGALWRTSPRRAPVAYHRLERHLLAMARASGLQIEQRGAGWTARRM